MNIQFVCGKIDLQKLHNTDFLICPTDTHFSASGGLDKAIRESAGPELTRALHGKKLAKGQVLITESFDLDVGHIVHASVPPCHFKGVNIEPLRECYRNILDAITAPSVSAEYQTAVIPLLGTGSCCWSYEHSMKALWLEILDYHRHHGSAYFDKRALEKLAIHYPIEASDAVLPYTDRASQAFFNAPDQWGWRGDPYLWYDLMDHFDDPRFNRISPRSFIGEIQRFFHQKTGAWLCGDTEIMLKEYAHGGMSSGGVSSFMATIGIPILCSNLVQLGFLQDMQPHFIIPVELQCMHQEKYQLQLPYELLPDLTHLRSSRHQMNDQRRIALDLSSLYFLTVYHYHGMPDLIDHYSLDVESANDSHYQFSPEAGASLCTKLGFMPVAIGAALKRYLHDNGGAALESLIKAISDKQFHY